MLPEPKEKLPTASRIRVIPAQSPADSPVHHREQNGPGNKLHIQGLEHRELLARLPVACYTLDAEGCLTFFNEAAVILWGRRPQVGKDFWCGSYKMSTLDGRPLPLPECPAAIALNERRVIRGVEAFVVRSDGSRRWIMPHIDLIFDDEGKLTGLINVVVDITDEREAQAKSRADAAFIQGIIRASPDAVAVLSIAGEIEWTNDACRQMMALSDHPSAQGTPWLQFWRNDAISAAAGNALDEARNGLTGQFRGSCITKELLTWWDVTTTPIFDHETKPTRLLCIARDVTALLASEKALREKEAFTRAVFNQAVTLFSVIACNGETLDINTASLAAGKLRRDDEIGRPFWETTWWRHSAQTQARIRSAVEDAANGKSSHFESMYQTAEGVERWSDVYFTPMKDGDTVVKILAEGRDVTELKSARRSIEAARDTAERASQAKDDFLAALSHELRMPLNPILLLASEAAEDPELTLQVRTDFAIIAKNAELEARLIDDLLDLTRITRGKMALEIKLVTVHAVLQEAILKVRPDLKAKGIDLILDFGASDSKVMGDSVRLEQIFWNVLRNAAKFTESGGTVKIITRKVEQGRLSVQITDDGMGMEPVELGRLFNAFNQGNHAGKTGSHRFGGLGLGLAISRMLVELHSGRIFAASPGLGLGSTFTVELPQPVDGKAIELLGTANGGKHPELLAVGTKTLLVDDHEPTRVALSQLLRRRHHEVTCAGSVEEALKAAAQQQFDLVITDIGLPDGDGYGLLKQLQGRGSMLSIALTGYGMEEDIALSRAAGFAAHLTKPIKIQALDEALALALRTPKGS
jgi:PAS domain S-box-containing protein